MKKAYPSNRKWDEYAPCCHPNCSDRKSEPLNGAIKGTNLRLLAGSLKSGYERAAEKIRRHVSHRPTSLCTLRANDSFSQTPQIVYPICRGIAIGLAKNLEKKTDSQNHTKTAGIPSAQKEITGRAGGKPGKTSSTDNLHGIMGGLYKCTKSNQYPKGLPMQCP